MCVAPPPNLYACMCVCVCVRGWRGWWDLQDALGVAGKNFFYFWPADGFFSREWAALADIYDMCARALYIEQHHQEAGIREAA